MNDDYLWDRSGPPDPEIERLERTLAPLRYRHRAALVQPAHSTGMRWWGVAAAAAAIAAAALLAVRTPPPGLTAWQVEGTQAPLRAGQTVRTADGSSVTLRSDDLGEIELGPDSELRASSDRRVTLDRGQLHARIWAPPREFVLDTPSARAVDLGCEYTIRVDPNGDGLLEVSMGWVAFHFDDRESFIPAGAACVTYQRRGPGIPFYKDAPETLRQPLAAFERGDSAALNAVLAAARPADAITVWHLLTRVPVADRGRVFDRFRELVALPKEVRREDVVRRDAHAIDQCWDALNLENTEWWRGWERRWGPS